MPAAAEFERQLSELDLSLFERIPSQSTENDRRSLLACQSATRALRPGYTYLEIGSHLGGSIQPHLLDSACSRIYSIDKRPASQPDSRGLSWKYPDNTTERMLESLRRVGTERQLEKLICIEGDVREVDRGRIEATADLCLVDGEHTDAALLADFEFSMAILGAQGALVFHDAQIVYLGLSWAIEKLRAEGVAFHAYNLPDTLLVVEVGDFPLHQDARIAQLLLDNHVGYLASLRMNDYFRQFANRPLLRHLRALKTRLTRENVSD